MMRCTLILFSRRGKRGCDTSGDKAQRLCGWEGFSFKTGLVQLRKGWDMQLGGHH